MEFDNQYFYMGIDEIEEIKSNDFHLVVDIIYESKLIDEQLLDLENAISFLKNKLDRNKAKIFVKKDNGRPIAFMVLYHKVNVLSLVRYNWHISYLYVKPEFRRKQIGKQIMLKCIDYARKTKVDHISLNTDTENYPAQQLYEGFGFNRMNFIANYYYYEMKLNG
ncbi:GNAT family N-acetyltransferase [Flavobacterium aquicola]|uniref:Acetyltransferase (GNAT) family protein n=1 Tax=Flavobacterium aquicola TaxID=1682742 RepID=A0A3E0E1V1_9FLAO|nr:GNAT family N-acetyltransferase [Flavobacterium aquicola]REG92272.1 acetyltransferase (GNAT) family protein [Flavobacterium aquicola]